MAPPNLSHYKQLQRRPSSEHPMGTLDYMTKSGAMQNNTSYGNMHHQDHSELSRINQSTPGGQGFSSINDHTVNSTVSDAMNVSGFPKKS